MIAPNMATMLGFVATDAPIARRAARSADRRQLPPRRSTASPSMATRRPTTASCCSRRIARRIAADRSRATIRACRAVTRGDLGGRRRARAGDRARRRRRDQVHHRSSSKAAATRRSATASRARSRIRRWSRRPSLPPTRTSAGSSAPSATPRCPISIPGACRSGSTMCWSSSTAPARRRIARKTASAS